MGQYWALSLLVVVVKLIAERRAKGKERRNKYGVLQEQEKASMAGAQEVTQK